MARRERVTKLSYGCPVEVTIDVIGGRWKSVLLFHLMQGTLRFGELRRLVPEATQRMITLQLRELEEDGVVHREVYREVPPRVEYSLTEFGRTLEPMLWEMRSWGDRFYERVIEQKTRTNTERKMFEDM